MCEIAEELPPEKAAQRMAELINSRLGVEVDPSKLHLFVLAYWSRLSPLAHAIHKDGRPPLVVVKNTSPVTPV